jgi:arsenate reductase (thioredoxin)
VTLRVLFLCTGNSARSQMAEAILNARGQGRFVAESAGSHPGARVNPLALETLQEFGIPWAGHPPRGVGGLEREHWDGVITVCDRAKEACPIFPGQPMLAHWSIPDPLDREGFRAAFRLLSGHIDLLLAIDGSTG